jgi:hypothetical protein
MPRIYILNRFRIGEEIKDSEMLVHHVSEYGGTSWIESESGRSNDDHQN